MLKLVLAYKNFGAIRNISHIGLGVSALNTSKVLRRGIQTEVWPITHASELRARLLADPATHVVISAPWIPSAELQALTVAFPDKRFAMNCHSNVGFLQADVNGVRLVREAMEVELGTHNFHLAGNSSKFCKWVEAAFGGPCTYLPNLYYLENDCAPRRQAYSGGTLRIGAFGAMRPLKNFLSAAGAAVQLAREMRCDAELWVSAGRAEGGGETVARAARAMLSGVHNLRLVENGWESWPKFRQTVGHMHLLLQPSYTESFNMVTADGIAEGVPSVVSEAIDWAPRHWQAPADDVIEIARTGRYLLFDPLAATDGFAALSAHNERGFKRWMHFLERA